GAWSRCSSAGCATARLRSGPPPEPRSPGRGRRGAQGGEGAVDERGVIGGAAGTQPLPLRRFERRARCGGQEVGGERVAARAFPQHLGYPQACLPAAPRRPRAEGGVPPVSVLSAPPTRFAG